MSQKLVLMATSCFSPSWLVIIVNWLLTVLQMTFGIVGSLICATTLSINKGNVRNSNEGFLIFLFCFFWYNEGSLINVEILWSLDLCTVRQLMMEGLHLIQLIDLEILSNTFVSFFDFSMFSIYFVISSFYSSLTIRLM